jgi:protein-S-isoprenylcysteine O-methyltransferase Ste14
MKFNIADRPNVLPWPPMIYVASALAAFALGRFYPLEFVHYHVFIIFGTILTFVGFALDLWAMVVMWRARTNILPHRGADSLIDSGPFRFTRNPIYLGNTVVMMGVSFYFDNGWFLLLGLVAAILVDHLAIRREEIHLAKRFGDEWRNYSTRTPRWLF